MGLKKKRFTEFNYHVICGNGSHFLEFFLLHPLLKEVGQGSLNNHFSHYPRSQVDINSYTRLKIAMSLIAGKA
jgi:hypothetical protein